MVLVSGFFVSKAPPPCQSRYGLASITQHSLISWYPILSRVAVCWYSGPHSNNQGESALITERFLLFDHQSIWHRAQDIDDHLSDDLCTTILKKLDVQVHTPENTATDPVSEMD
jgi:hypothetical protein